MKYIAPLAAVAVTVIAVSAALRGLARKPYITADFAHTA